MIPALICVAASCMLVSSVPQSIEKSTLRKSLGFENEVSLSKDCREMNRNGELIDLLSQLRKAADEVLKVDLVNRSQVDQIESQVSALTSSVGQFLIPEWNQEKWDLQSQWNLRGRDFLAISDLVIETGFELQKLEVVDVRVGGEIRKDLLPLLQVQYDSHGAQILLHKPATSLELCQLQDTIVVQVNYEFKFVDRIFAGSGNLKMHPGAEWQPAGGAL